MSASHERLVADAADAVLVLDPAADRIRYANGGAHRLLGYERGELLGVRISSIYPAQAAQLDAFLAGVVEHGLGWTRSLCLRARSGTSFPAENCAVLIATVSAPLVLLLARDRSRHRAPEA
jgi:PAS domain S-box-containing protein